MRVAATDRQRIGSALAVLLVHGLAAYALLVGLGVAPPPAAVAPLVPITLLAPPEPAKPPRQPVKAVSLRPKPKDAPAPPARRAVATPVVAPPPPILVVQPPPPVIAAPLANSGNAPDNGAADDGRGTGAGGVGNGTGGGGTGGDGDGGTPPRKLRGRMRDSDFPLAAIRAGLDGIVTVRFTVNIQGRVEDCEVTDTSGSPLLDANTCRLITERWRFDPARNAAGRKIRSFVEEQHEWGLRRSSSDDPADPPPE